jgi:hypothetical protein
MASEAYFCSSSLLSTYSSLFPHPVGSFSQQNDVPSDSDGLELTM